MANEQIYQIMRVPIDESSISSFVYPSNYSVRAYQKSIVEQALFRNTLVCLPTGLGKTLIAAVVMYNYYRWFPTGKIVFMAPSKPLVSQQISACHQIMGIPEADTAHLEGSVQSDKREVLWREKRVFFCTPQTLQNDIQAGIIDPTMVVCVVVDEAHKATDGYAYTTVVSLLHRFNSFIRVLALSATPGTDLRKIQTVIRNLRISHLEVRTEEDPEVKPYVHSKQIEVMKCEKVSKDGGAKNFKELLNELMQGPLNAMYSAQLLDCTIPSNLNIFTLQEAELNLASAESEGGVLDPQQLEALKSSLVDIKDIMECRKILGQSPKELLSALEALQRKRQSNRQNSVVAHKKFQALLSAVRQASGTSANPYKQQPKLRKLGEVLVDHFARHNKTGSSTRVLVFTQLRTTVHEIKTALLEVAPGIILPHEFVGQSTKTSADGSSANQVAANKGLTQAEQAHVLEQFNRGVFNVLVATCIAEEGLDIAEVDLIVLFDAVSSPIRFTQRCGRTGRKRSGRVVMLVTEGSDEEKIRKSTDSADSISKVLVSAKRSLDFFADGPAMIPPELGMPSICMQHMQVNEFHLSQVGGSHCPKLQKQKVSKQTATQKVAGPGPQQTSIQSAFARSSSSSSSSSSFAHNNSSGPRPLSSTSAVTGSSNTMDGVEGAGEDSFDPFGWDMDERSQQASSFDHPPQASTASTPLFSKNSACSNPNGKQFSSLIPMSKKAAPEFSSSSRAAHPASISCPATGQPTGNKEAFKSSEGSTYMDLCAWEQDTSSSSATAEIIDLSGPTPCREPQRADPPIASVFDRLRAASSSALPQPFIAAIVPSTGTFFTRSGIQVDARDIYKPSLVLNKLTNVVESTSRFSHSFVLPSDTEDDATQDPAESVRASPICEARLGVPLWPPPLPTSSAAPVNESQMRAAQALKDEDSEDLQHCLNLAEDEEAEEAEENDTSDVEPSEVMGGNRSTKPVVHVVASNFESFDNRCVDVATNRQAAAVESSDKVPVPSSQLSRISHAALSSSGRSNKSGFWTMADGDDGYPSSSNSDTPVSKAPLVPSQDHRLACHANDGASCCICLDPSCDEDDPIVICDGCEESMHLSCYGIALSELPEGDYYCEACQDQKDEDARANRDDDRKHKRASSRRRRKCVLCKKAGGMLKRSVDGEWTHPICVLFTVELSVDNKMRANNLCEMDPDRRDLQCEVCAEKGGCCVQCREPTCLRAFHPFCAYDSRTQMVLRDVFCSQGGDSYTSHEIYCKAHRGRVNRKNGEIMSCRVPVLLHQAEEKGQGDEKGRGGKSKNHKRSLEVRGDENNTRKKKKTKTKKKGEKEKLDDEDEDENGDGNGDEDDDENEEEEEDEEEEEEQKKKQKKKMKRKKKKNSTSRGIFGKGMDTTAYRCFDLEAACSDSGTDGGDDRSADDDEDEDEDEDDNSVVAGFINDGAYTQLSENSHSRYLAFNRKRAEVMSPDSLDENGNPNVRKLVRGGARRSKEALDDSIIDSSTPANSCRDPEFLHDSGGADPGVGVGLGLGLGYEQRAHSAWAETQRDDAERRNSTNLSTDFRRGTAGKLDFSAGGGGKRSTFFQDAKRPNSSNINNTYTYTNRASNSLELRSNSVKDKDHHEKNKDKEKEKKNKNDLPNIHNILADSDDD